MCFHDGPNVRLSPWIRLEGLEIDTHLKWWLDEGDELQTVAAQKVSQNNDSVP